MLLDLLIGLGLLLAGLLTCCLATAVIVRVAVRLIRRGYTERGFWRSFAVMTIVTVITAAAHALQIALWALAYLACGEVTDFETAFYVSGENYTALGYGDIILSPGWRLLGPLEAINGLLLFGLSTAILFTVLSNLVRNYLRAELDRPAVAPEEKSPSPLPDGWQI